MADIELVIKIPEEMYEWVNDVNKFFDDYGISDFIDLVKNGTPLPKEHGRLVDAGALKSGLEKHKNLFINAYGKYSNMPVPEKIRVDEITQCIAGIVNAPTIIEATKESE